MFVCPNDMHWCDLTRCRSDGCKLSGEQPFLLCHECGAFIVRNTAFGLCIECIIVEAKQKKERA